MNRKSIIINLFVAVLSLLIGMTISDYIQTEKYEKYIAFNKELHEGTYWSQAYRNIGFVSMLREGNIQDTISLLEKYIESDIEGFMNFDRPPNEHELKTLDEARKYYSEACEEQCLSGIKPYLKQDITKP